jgi:hypothetical protein
VLAGAALLAGAAAFALTESIGTSSDATTRSEAFNVALEFFTSLNLRRYERTCDLLADGYLTRHHLESPRQCSLGLRIGFMWSKEIQFRMGDVHPSGSLTVVEAVADGVRGELVAAREGDRLKVQAVRGG